MTNSANSKLTDVRMKGFASRSTVEAAVAWIDSSLVNANADDTDRTEPCGLFELAGRVLAKDIVSTISVPGFTRSMMDGFALRADETYGATPYNSLSFQVIGTSFPGRPFEGTVRAGTAVRIMTGAPMPEGADAVLPVEFTEWTESTLAAAAEVSVGKNVGAIGEDVAEGSVLLKAGRVLRPQDAGVLSSIGCSSVPVLRRPVVRILITGNELLPAGTAPTGYQIADANGPMLTALVERDSGCHVLPQFVPDDKGSLRAAMLEPADVVLVSGGSSVGQEDHAPEILKELGTLAIHGIAMRPSSPAGMGRIGTTFVFLLPGNPVSCLCAYDFFAGRAIRGLGGRSLDWPYAKKDVVLTRKLVSTVGRVDYARVKINGTEAEPLAISGASVLSSTTQADGFIIIPADSEGLPPQARVTAYLY